MIVVLETARVLLRRFTEDDVDNLFDVDSDPDVMRFLTGGKPTRRDVIRDETLPASSATTNVSRAMASGRRSRSLLGNS
jgi:RimJ/RimL family protein N-acetyltransferase